MVTLDGLAYDFQQVGEYVWFTNDADVVVQARTAPWGASTTAAVQTAVAAGVAGDRVGYYAGAAEPLLVNGVPAAVPSGGLSLPQGGRLSRSISGYTVEWPSGESLSILPRGSYLDLRISIPDRTRPYSGLLGTWDGHTSDDLVSRDGTVFTQPLSRDVLYGAFGDSWRISNAESLFDYAPGLDTSSFTDEAFPTHQITSSSLPTDKFNQAHAACVAAGVDKPTDLQGCILDVAVADGNPAAAQAAAAAAPLQVVAALPPFGYSQDFEDTDDGHWSAVTRKVLPPAGPAPETTVLGPFRDGGPVTLNLTGLPSHQSITVAFDTHMIGGWEGESFDLVVAGVTLVAETSFSNGTAEQAFPGKVGEGLHPAQTGAFAVDEVDLGAGPLPHAIYHHSYTFNHSSGSVALSFMAPSLSMTASWALDNVEVTTSQVGDPWQPTCIGGASLDDGNPCTVDSCDPNLGVVHRPRPAGTLCSDADVCNGEETCNGSGQCAHNPLVLTDSNPCTSDSCDPMLGVVHTPLAVGTSCADSNVCNGAETCDGLGSCRPGTPPLPSSLPPDTTCNGIDDDCNGAIDDGYVGPSTSCGVGACAAAGQLHCVGGQVFNDCQPLFPAPSDVICDGIDDDCDGQVDEDSCDDGNPCTVDTCDPAVGCRSVPNVGLGCNDADACTQGDHCDAAGACTGGTPVNSDDGNPCTDDLCDPIAGVQHLPMAGRACDDGNACTVSDSCNGAGACVATATRNCSDGLFCDGPEGCDPSLGCLAGTPPNVNDNIACTTDSCDEANDVIVHAPNDAACDDHSVCTGVEICAAGLGCQAGTPLQVNDNNGCTVDACDPIAGVSHTPTPTGSSCGNGKYCDGAGQCLAFGQCATNLVVAAGQNLTFTGPCEINSITFNGGNLTINGALKTAAITLQSGGSLNVSHGSLLSDAVTVSNGSVNVDDAITGVVKQSGGSIRVGGTFSAVQSGDLALSGGTFTNEGTVQLPVFDGSVATAGTFINRGRLDLASDALVVPAGVTFSESGTLGANDSIGSLSVNGTLTHDRGYAAGLSFTVTGDAVVGSTGVIDVSSMGLRGGLSSGNTSYLGEIYASNFSSVVLGPSVTVGTGGTHGGVGGSSSVAAYDLAQTPALLGSGGSSNVNCGAVASGNGGGRIDLVINGSLTATGAIRANGGDTPSNTCTGGGGGGTVRLRVGTLAGTGSVQASGGNASNGGSGGGGGRVAVEYASRTQSGTILARGGTGNNGPGSAGTVYLKNTTTGAAELQLDSGSQSSSTTLQPGDIAGATLRVTAGTVNLANGATPVAITQTSGTLNVLGTLSLAAGTLTLSGGTLVNAGSMSLPVFDGSVATAGTFINRGRLDLASNALVVPAGVTFSESGTLGANDSIGSLSVNGTLTHDRGYAAGLSFTVTGDAVVGSTGVIDVSSMGLRGGLSSGNTSYLGEIYASNFSSVVLGPSVTVGTGGTHGGVGGSSSVAAYDLAQTPALLGSGGSSNVNCGAVASGNGGGRIDLVINGSLTATGAIRANGGDTPSNTCTGGGGGGTVRLRVGTLAGTGSVQASGGNASNGGSGGGGGRVAVEYASRTQSGTILARGGTGNNGPGSAGTVYLKNTTTGAAELQLDSGSQSSSTTLQPGDIAGATLRVTAGTVNLANGATPVAITQTSGTLNVLGTLSLAAGTLTLSGGTLVNAGSMSLPVFDGSVATAGTFINRGRLDLASDALVVPAGVTFSESGTLGANDSIGSLSVNGTLTHDRGYAAGLSFTVTGDAVVGSTGVIDVSSMGLRGGLSSGNTSYLGEIYASNFSSVVLGPSVTVGTGGTHGGVGGSSSVAAYDLAQTPALLGSGGSSNVNCGAVASGNGGGRIDLVINGSLTATGAIRANGGDTPSNTCTGGGGGGTVRLRVGTLAGTGSVQASGGNASNGGSGGGGGRVAVEYASRTQSGTILARGGTGNNGPGSAGTVYLKNTTTGAAELQLDSGSQSSSTTLQPGDIAGATLRVTAGTVNLANGATPVAITQTSGTLNVLGTLSLAAGTLTLSGGTLVNAGSMSLPVFDGSVATAGTFINRGRLDLASNALVVPAGVTFSESGTLGANDSIGSLSVNGTLTHDRGYAAGLSFTVTGDAVVGSTGVIDVSSMGLRGGLSSGNTSYLGEIYASNFSSVVLGPSVTVGTGGTHGGVGGSSSVAAYDLAQTPALLGSGGSSNVNCGAVASGNGGGRIDLVINGSLTATGAIRANGGDTPSNTCTGGGGGGTVRLRVGTLAGTGSVQASGGNASNGGSGGGGGRVAVEYASRTQSGTVLARGGTGSNGPGSAGTVYLKNTTTGAADLSVDNAALSSTATLQAADVAGVTLRVPSGTVTLVGTAAPVGVVVTAGTLNMAGSVMVGAGGLSMTGGTVVNTGSLRLPAFDAQSVGVGTFINRGELDIASQALEIAAGVTFNESGTLGPADSIGSLVVQSGGKLTHDLMFAPGLAFTVTGNATISGSIDVSGLGLRGGLTNGNGSQNGETYASDQTSVVLWSSGNAGGSHGGLGGASSPPTYGLATAPVLLGSGGSASISLGSTAGSGGGRVDLVVNGTLSLPTGGSIKANGTNGAGTSSGGGAGGSIRLRVGTLTGAGTISANSGSASAGGGGGRVALEYATKSYTGTLTALGSGTGAAGSVSERNVTTTPGTATAAIDASADGVCQLTASGVIICLGDDAHGLVSQAPVGVYKRLAVGAYAACALHESGLASCWADIGPQHLHDTPTQALTEISVGLTAACGIRSSDSAILCWGDDSDRIVSGKPVGTFTNVYMGDTAACARASSGALSCWGNDSSGAVSQRPSLSVQSVDGGAGFFCAVQGSGALSCWGSNDYGQSMAPPTGNYARVAAGLRHACALDLAGNISCWGDNAYGQSTVPAATYSDIAAGDTYSCGMTASGLSCWGAPPPPL